MLGAQQLAQVLRLRPKVNDPNVLVKLSTVDDTDSPVRCPTSGGFLIAAEAKQLEELIDQLQKAFVVEATDIGMVIEDSNCQIRVSFS